MSFCFLFVGAALPVMGEASSFRIEYRTLSNPEAQAVFLQSLEKPYRFVTERIGDPVDRTRCPIFIRFEKLQNAYAQAISRGPNHCDDELVLNETLEGNWRAPIVIAHELTHLIHFAHNQNQPEWFNEGLASQMEALYLGLWPTHYEFSLKLHSQFSLSNHPKDYGNKGQGYAAAFLLLRYLYNRFGYGNFLKKVVQSQQIGWSAIEEVARSLHESNRHHVPPEFLNRRAIFNHFAVALLINDPVTATAELLNLDGDYTALALSQASTRGEAIALIRQEALLEAFQNTGQANDIQVPDLSAGAIRYFSSPTLIRAQTLCDEKRACYSVSKSKSSGWQIEGKERILKPGATWSPRPQFLIVIDRPVESNDMNKK
jgi:hypothetical protein